jgi:hypothetical protein
MFLSGCDALEVNHYMTRSRKAVNLQSARDRSHLHGLAWLRRYERFLTGTILQQRFNWTPTGLCPITTVQGLEDAFAAACFP